MFAKIRAMFEVSITFDHNAKSGETPDALGSAPDRHMSTDFDRQMQVFGFIYIWLAAVVLVLMVLLVLHAICFHINYLSSLHYRNFYLTRDFFEISKAKPTDFSPDLLPLRPNERKILVAVSSFLIMSIEHLLQLLLAAGLLAPVGARGAPLQRFPSPFDHHQLAAPYNLRARL